MEKRKAFEISSFECKVLDIDYLIEHIEDFDISGIDFDLEMQVGSSIVAFADIEHPIVYTEGFFFNKTLVICKEYYYQNKDKCDRLIVEICKKTKNQSLYLRKREMVNDNALDAIVENQNITEINLGSVDDVFELDVATYKKLKGTHIETIDTKGVCPELKDNFDTIIGYNHTRNLIGYNTYDTLSKAGILYVTQEVSDEEIYNFKFLREGASVTIKFENCHRVVEILNRLKELGRTGKITIDIENKNVFNNYLFSHINEIPNMQNVMVDFLGNDHDLLSYLKYEKRLIDLVRPAMNLSPFERYLYAYNVTKQFKEYKESEENKQKARDLYQILDNEFMVCVGYSKLLGDLLDKLEIGNFEHGVSVEIGLDDIPIDATIIPDFIENKKTKKVHEVKIEDAGHSRRKVHLVDPKYGIDGYYIADPTWDNDLQNDAYNFALMTIDEYVGTDRYNYFNMGGHSELFFVHSIEEFYQKLNILLDKNSNRTVLNFIDSLYIEFCSLDKEFAVVLKDKYPLIGTYKNRDMSKEEIQNILLDIGEHIVERSNNIVTGRQFKEGIRVLYENCYGLEQQDIDSKLEETMEFNKKRNDKAFPRRYKIDKYGNEMVVMNAVNKFGLDNEMTLK